MTGTLRLAYAEHESGDVPFAWLDGTRLNRDDMDRAQLRIGDMRAHGRQRRSELGLAIRHRDRLLIQTTRGFGREDGGPQGAVVVILSGIGKGQEWETVMAATIAAVFREAGITTDENQLRAVLEWAGRLRSGFERGIFNALKSSG